VLRVEILSWALMTLCHGSFEVLGRFFRVDPTSLAAPGNPASEAICPYVAILPVGI